MTQDSLQHLSKEIALPKRAVRHIESMLSEDFELSDQAKKALASARATPESEYVDL